MNVPQRYDGGCRGPTSMIFCVLLITLLVFGVNVATAADPAVVAEPSSSTEATSTRKPAFQCGLIPPTESVESIIKECKGAMGVINVLGSNKYTFDISKQTETAINEFFTSLNNVAFYLNVLLVENNAIKTVNLGGIIAFNPHGNIIIRNNRNLDTIEGGAANLVFPNDNVVIRGNRYLTEESIRKLKAMAEDRKVDIQEEKECIVPSFITDLKDLNDCGSVYGDLTFTNWPMGTTTNEIKWIQGNVKIVNTDLRKLPFSQTGKIKIDGNLEFKDNIGLCWINDENYKDYFDVKGKVKVRNTPCPYPPSAPINKTTKKTKKTKKTTTTVAPTVTEEGATTKNSDTVFAVIPTLSALFIILL